MRDEAGQIVSRCLPCSLPNDRYLALYRAHVHMCMHLELEIKDSAVSYEPGDHVGVWGENTPVNVDHFLFISR